MSTNEDAEAGSQPTMEIYGYKPKIMHRHQHKTAIYRSMEKQWLSKINWMRLLCRYRKMFEEIIYYGIYTLGLRFFVGKKMVSQLIGLETTFNGDVI
jgi:hypothetical protein